MESIKRIESYWKEVSPRVAMDYPLHISIKFLEHCKRIVYIPPLYFCNRPFLEAMRNFLLTKGGTPLVKLLGYHHYNLLTLLEGVIPRVGGRMPHIVALISEFCL